MDFRMALKDSLDQHLPESLELDFLMILKESLEPDFLTTLKDSLDKHLLESLELEFLTALKDSRDRYLLKSLNSLDFLTALEDSMDSLLAQVVMLKARAVTDGSITIAKFSSPNSHKRPATSTAAARTAPPGGS